MLEHPVIMETLVSKQGDLQAVPGSGVRILKELSNWTSVESGAEGVN